MNLHRLSILGVGLLGGSLGLAVKKAFSDCRVMGYGHRPDSLDRALAMGAIDESSADPVRAVEGADLVVLCTPVQTIGPLLRQVAPALKPGAIVTDVGSTKRSIVRAAREGLGKNVRFVGSHPMAGSEKRGVEFARPDLFAGAVCILTPHPNDDPDTVGDVERFWQAVGMKTTRLSPDEHDHLLACVSHLPHALAAALVSMQPDDALGLAGNGFRDVTRIAAGDPGLWRDILVDNADEVRRSLRSFRAGLDELDAALEAADAAAVEAFLARAAERRKKLK
jgi:prephenate dehydrogenase